MVSDKSISAAPRGNPLSLAAVTLIVPIGRTGRSTRLRLPPAAALWLRDQLIEAIGAPKPRRIPRIRRGRWQPKEIAK